jgi:hypothetical protein
MLILAISMNVRMHWYTYQYFTLIASNNVRLEVFTAVTMKNGVFWDVTPCGSCKNRRFGGTSRLLHLGDENRWLGRTLAVTSNRRTLHQTNSSFGIREYVNWTRSIEWLFETESLPPSSNSLPLHSIPRESKLRRTFTQINLFTILIHNSLYA